MKLSEGVSILTITIDTDYRHQDYEHVCKIAKDNLMFATGEDVECRLKRFNGGETEQMFLQRKILTITNVADMYNSCVKPFNQAARTPATIIMNWVGKDATDVNEKKKRIEKTASNFWGKKSVKNYLSRKTGNKDAQDPNSWVVVEFKERVDPKDTSGVKQKPKPYPFEVKAEEAIDFVLKNNETQYLTVLNKTTMEDADGKILEAEKYYMYLDNHTLKATEIHFEKIGNVPNVVLWNSISDFDSLKPDTNYLFATSEEEEKDKHYYVINVFETKFGFVPAKRFGSETDPLTDHRTCVSLVDKAKSYFEDCIQTMSEFSLTKRLHTFPQKWQYLPKCDADGCFKGYVDGDKPCKVCKGTGTTTHSSSQDIVGIKMPDDLKEIVNLDMMATYKGPPIDLIKFQKEFGYEDIRRYAQSAVFNNEIGRRRVKTATETEIDAEAVNNTVKPFGDNWSDLYEFIYNCIAVLEDLNEGFEITHQFPDDFQLQTIGEILDDLKKANDNGAPSHIKKAITRKLTHKIYIDQPREILKNDTKEKYYPFPGKSETEVQFILATPGLATKYSMVLYSNFDLIFSDLEYDYSIQKLDFYELEEPKQREAVKAKVNEYIADIKVTQKEDAALNFTPDVVV